MSDDDGYDEDDDETGAAPPPVAGIMGMSVPPELLEMIRGAASPEHREKQSMQREADQIRVQRFIENLETEQLQTLLWLMETLSAEGQHNYTTFLIRGMLLATAWARTPLEVPGG